MLRLIRDAGRDSRTQSHLLWCSWSQVYKEIPMLLIVLDRLLVRRNHSTSISELIVQCVDLTNKSNRWEEKYVGNVLSYESGSGVLGVETMPDEP